MTAPVDLRLEPIACEKCEEGLVEVEVPARRDAEEPAVELVRCAACEGTGVEACVGCGDRPATLRGEDGRAYCGVRCAHDDGNWSTCLGAGCLEAQDPIHAPFCGPTCTSAFLGIYAERAARA